MKNKIILIGVLILMCSCQDTGDLQWNLGNPLYSLTGIFIGIVIAGGIIVFSDVVSSFRNAKREQRRLNKFHKKLTENGKNCKVCK